MKIPKITNKSFYPTLFTATVLPYAIASAQSEATYQFYRFTNTQTVGEGVVQVSEFNFINNDETVDATAVTVTNPGGDSPAGEDPSKLVDGDTGTKWLDFNIAPLVFEFPAAVTIDSYNFATANDVLARTPASWTFEGSTDGTTWVELDNLY